MRARPWCPHTSFSYFPVDSLLVSIVTVSVGSPACHSLWHTWRRWCGCRCREKQSVRASLALMMTNVVQKSWHCSYYKDHRIGWHSNRKTKHYYWLSQQQNPAVISPDKRICLRSNNQQLVCNKNHKPTASSGLCLLCPAGLQLHAFTPSSHTSFWFKACSFSDGRSRATRTENLLRRKTENCVKLDTRECNRKRALCLQSNSSLFIGLTKKRLFHWKSKDSKKSFKVSLTRFKDSSFSPSLSRLNLTCDQSAWNNT